MKDLRPSDMVRSIGPVGKPELEALQQAREKPTLVLEHRIGGATEEIIHRMEQERRAVRESYIAHRLERIRGDAEHGFAFARVKCKARSDFERER